MKLVLDAVEQMYNENVDPKLYVAVKLNNNTWSVDPTTLSKAISFLQHKPTSVPFYILSQRDVRKYLQGSEKPWTPNDLPTQKFWQVQWYQDTKRFHIWNLSPMASSEIVAALQKDPKNVDVQAKETQR